MFELSMSELSETDESALAFSVTIIHITFADGEVLQVYHNCSWLPYTIGHTPFCAGFVPLHHSTYYRVYVQHPSAGRGINDELKLLIMRIFWILFIGIGFTGIFFQTVQAQTTESLTVEESVERGLEYNFRVHATSADDEAAEAADRMSQADRLPSS